jgi:hypothetical protein
MEGAEDMSPTKRLLDQMTKEAFSLDRFLQVVEMYPNSITRGMNPPDFVLTQNKKQIAVEVTAFHSDDSGPEGHPRRLIEEECTLGAFQ